jgi:hypothetical protein
MYSPAEREARMKAVFDPANVARANEEAKKYPNNPDYFNGIDVRNMGASEYMALKGMTGQQEADLGAARQFYALPANERGAAPAAVNRAMAPGPSQVTQFGAAVEERTRGSQAEAAKLQAKLAEAEITAGGKAATDATKRWDSYQASVPRELRALGKADPNKNDPGLGPEALDWASGAIGRVLNSVKAYGGDVPGPDLIQRYAQIARQYIRPRSAIIAQLQLDNPKLKEQEIAALADVQVQQDQAKATQAELALLQGMG